MRDAMRRFEGRDIEARVLDIEGCYPKMPKEVIRFAMRAIVQEARREGRSGVSVPTRSKERKPTWKKVDGGPYKWISFGILLDALDFALDNAVFALVGPLYSRLWRSARPLSGAEGFRYGSLASPALLLCRLRLTQRAPPGRGGGLRPGCRQHHLATVQCRTRTAASLAGLRCTRPPSGTDV